MPHGPWRDIREPLGAELDAAYVNSPCTAIVRAMEAPQEAGNVLPILENGCRPSELLAALARFGAGTHQI